MNRDDACDYIIVKAREAGVGLNNLKLQKLMYYAQAWHLALHSHTLFSGKFQAWVHGPVNRELYDRFAPRKTLYSDITEADIRPDFDMTRISEDEAGHIDEILEAYAGFSGTQLENMTHHEAPWIMAREGFRPSQRCEVEIDEDLMAQYYAQRLKQA